MISMAESSSTPRSYDLGSLCVTCSQIFQGTHSLGALSVLMESSTISLANPQNCRLCSLIWDKHKSFTQDLEKEGKTPNLLKIQYYFREGKDELLLDLNLDYAKSERQILRVALIPSAEGQCR